MERHRVAVTVLVELDAVDNVDAFHIAEDGLRQALRQANQDETGATLVVRFRRHGHERDVTVKAVRELSSALRNGYVSAGPTGKAFRSPELGA